MSGDSLHYQGALLEEMNDRLQAILEGIGPLATMPARLNNLEEDMVEVKGDIKVIKLAVRDISNDLAKRDFQGW